MHITIYHESTVRKYLEWWKRIFFLSRCIRLFVAWIATTMGLLPILESSLAAPVNQGHKPMKKKPHTHTQPRTFILYFGFGSIILCMVHHYTCTYMLPYIDFIPDFQWPLKLFQEFQWNCMKIDIATWFVYFIYVVWCICQPNHSSAIHQGHHSYLSTKNGNS